MSALDKVKAFTTGPRAPWIIGGLGLAAVYFWWTRTPAAPGDGDATGAAGAVYDENSGQWIAAGDTSGGFTTGYGGVVNPRIPPTIPAPEDPDDPATDPADTLPLTNDQWINRAISYLMSRLVTAEFAQSALMKAAGGEPMSIAEMAAVSLAMQALGPPPQGFPAMNAAPLPPPPGIPQQPPPPQEEEPAPPTPIEPVPPTEPTEPPAQPAGKFLALTRNFLGVNMGTSLVLDRIARNAGMPAILSDTKTRKVVNRTAIDRIWYHPNNAALRAKYGGDWTKINAGDKVYVPA